MPNSARVLAIIAAEPGRRVGAFVEPAQALLTMIEAVRLLLCLVRFEKCNTPAVQTRAVGEICSLIDEQQVRLTRFMGPSGVQTVCASFLQGDHHPMLRAIAQPLHYLVRAALPWATTPAPMFSGTRFYFEYFYEEQANVYDKRRRNGTQTQLLSRLAYPAILSPGEVCTGRSEYAQAARTGNRNIRADDVAEALRRLEGQGVPLSRFVVNFGAADGECGEPGDWNWDPANCMIAAGASGLLVEGHPPFCDVLANKFKGRSNVSLALGYMALDNVTNLLRSHIGNHSEVSWSPDLLKVDLDHADCLFLEEALRAVQPKFLHVEYFSHIPPPLEYVQKYQDVQKYQGILLGTKLEAPPQQQAAGVHRHFGCSLSAVLRRTPGYALVYAGMEDVLLVRSDLQPSLGVGAPPDPWESWLDGSFCHPQHFYSEGETLWGFDFRLLADRKLDIKDRMIMLQALLEESGTSEFSLTVAEPPP